VLKPILFWDSAALIRAVLGETHNLYRQLLQWGEMGAVDMRLSRDVTRETEHVLRRFGEDIVEDFARILDRARFALTLDPAAETVNWCVELTGYRPDAHIVAAAHECGADVLLTFDRQHLLDNPLLGPPEMRCVVRTPGECLEWLRTRLTNAEKPDT
jgi:predicted nucleic acid-binding protein